QVWGVAASVDQDDRLLTRGECLLQCRFERMAENHEAPVVFLRALLPKINDIRIGKRPGLDAMRHPQKRVLAARGVLPALQRRSRRSEDHGDVAELSADDCEIARVVARRFVLLVRAVALLVDDDHAELLKRREERGARTDGHVDLAAASAPPLVVALARR